MAIYANIRDYSFESDVDDIRGSDIYGADNQPLGTISDVIFDTGSGDLQYVVVDAGGWLESKRFVVPAREVMSDVEGNDRFRVSVTREQIERFPAYDENELSDTERWRDYEERYTAARDLKEGPILHREGSTHAITPEPEEMPVGADDVRVSSSLPEGRRTRGPDPLVTSENIQPGRRPRTPEERYERFKERLRKEREEILRKRRAA